VQQLFGSSTSVSWPISSVTRATQNQPPRLPVGYLSQIAHPSHKLRGGWAKEVYAHCTDYNA